MADATDSQVLSGVTGFFALALATPALFLIFGAFSLRIDGATDIIKIFLMSIPVALYGIFVYPSWLLVALGGSVGLVYFVPHTAPGRWSFVLAFSAVSAMWASLVPGFPKHIVWLSCAAGIAAIFAVRLRTHLYASAAT